LEVHIDDKELEKLYVSGKSKKLKLSANVVNKYFAAIEYIDAAHNIYDLWNNPSLNFEKYKQHYSIRLTRKFRLEMEINWTNQDKTIGEFHLFAISNHYGD